jgi:hypothetical protein
LLISSNFISYFNQRRGFKSSRKDKKDEQEKIEEIKYPIYEKWFEVLKVDSITELTQEKDIFNYQIVLSSNDKSIIAEKKRRRKPDWEGKQIEFEVTKKTVKSGEITYTISEPDRSDWEKLKIAHEKDLKASGFL